MTVASIARHPVVVGLILWAVTLMTVPAPIAARLWLGVPFVLVPRLAPALAVAGVRRSSTAVVAPAAAWPWLAVGAGVLAAASFVAPTGRAAAGMLMAPWWLLCVGGGFAAIQRLRAERTWSPTLLGLIRSVADGFLVLGATALLADRLALDPMAFGAPIVLLTAVHFSLAGYGLLSVAALLAVRGSRAAQFAAVGLMVGMPMTAVGFVIHSPVAGWPGTLVVAGSGMLTAVGLTRAPGASRRIRAVAVGGGLALAIGMTLALGWSTAQLLGAGYLDLPAMVGAHGALNLLAVLAAACVLALDPRSIRAAARPVSQTSGALIALAIAIPVAMVVTRLDFGTIDRLSEGLAVGALVGPAVASWIVAARHPWPTGRPVRAVLLQTVMTVVVACLATAVIVGIGASGEPLASVAIVFVFGLLFVGWVGLLAALPCAAVWVWVMQGRRAATTLAAPR